MHPCVPPWMGQFAVAGYQAPELSYWGERKENKGKYFDRGVRRFSWQHPPNVVSHSIRHFRNRDALLSKKRPQQFHFISAPAKLIPDEILQGSWCLWFSDEQGWQVFSPWQPAGPFTACWGLALPEPWCKWQDHLAGETRWHHAAPCTLAKELPAGDFCLQFGFW